jgi:TolA-binding protein
MKTLFLLLLIIAAGCTRSGSERDSNADLQPGPRAGASAASTEQALLERRLEIEARAKEDREAQIRQEQSRIDGIRRANQLDAMERNANADRNIDELSSNSDYVVNCSSRAYADLMKRLKLEPSKKFQDMCVPIGNKDSHVIGVRCPSCQ